MQWHIKLKEVSEQSAGRRVPNCGDETFTEYVPGIRRCDGACKYVFTIFRKYGRVEKIGGQNLALFSLVLAFACEQAPTSLVCMFTTSPDKSPSRYPARRGI